MNIKAERIEQLVQVINRNFMFICSSQPDAVTGFERRKLEKVDAVIFGHDKFAYEMVYFLDATKQQLEAEEGERRELEEKERQRSANNPNPNKPKFKGLQRDLYSLWNEMFCDGLEAMMVECAVLQDEIERDCFVSRVYCWFTEKLSERREVPRDPLRSIAALKHSLEGINSEGKHMLHAVEKYEQNARSSPQSSPTKDIIDYDDKNPLELPPINQLVNQNNRPKKIPTYTKHNFPDVFNSTANLGQPGRVIRATTYDAISMDDNFGLLYNNASSEAERTMNELWLARRRQEAFDYKNRQQLAIVMDRLALQKARLETDSLRKQESELLMKMQKERQTSTSNGSTAGRSMSPSGRPTSSDNNRLFMSSISQKLMSKDGQPFPYNVTGNLTPERMRRSPTKASVSSINGLNLTSSQDQPLLEHTVIITGQTGENGTTMTAIPPPSRVAVTKTNRRESQSHHAPMRFKLSLPDGYLEKHQYYMQLSDSDDEKPVSTRASQVQTAGGEKKKGGGNNKQGGNNKGATQVIYFKHEKPEVRDRPQSATILRSLAMNDPELKVHYRFTNYRRGALTTEQEQWLDAQEHARKHKSEEMAKALAEAVAAKNNKGKGGKDGKDKGKDGGKDSKKESKKDNKSPGKNRPSSGKAGDTTGGAGGTGAPGELGPDGLPISLCKYKSANEFMSVHFPKFDNDLQSMDDQTSSAINQIAPMRIMQLMEIGDIMTSCKHHHVMLKDNVLKKALLIPQDKPDAICLENLRTESEGLMLNPLPQEYWRKYVMKKGKKGGKKKKK